MIYKDDINLKSFLSIISLKRECGKTLNIYIYEIDIIKMSTF